MRRGGKLRILLIILYLVKIIKEITFNIVIIVIIVDFLENKLLLSDKIIVFDLSFFKLEK